MRAVSSTMRAVSAASEPGASGAGSERDSGGSSEIRRDPLASGAGSETAHLVLRSSSAGALVDVMAELSSCRQRRNRASSAGTEDEERTVHRSAAIGRGTCTEGSWRADEP